MLIRRYRAAVTFMGSCLALACGSSEGTSSETGAGADTLTVVVSATTADFAHADGLAGQTATQVRAGVSRLELRTADANAWVLVDAAPGEIEVSYDDSARTTLATLDPSELQAGHYVEARLVQDWSRFRAEATLHVGNPPTAAMLSAFIVTSDGVFLDGNNYDAGHYDWMFLGDGLEGEGVTGEDFPIPAESFTAGARAVFEDGRWTVVFPIDLHISEQTRGTLDVSVNMHEAFRWVDEARGDYQAGQYDCDLLSCETVAQFGGNRFDVTLSESR